MLWFIVQTENLIFSDFYHIKNTVNSCDFENQEEQKKIRDIEFHCYGIIL